MHPRKYARVKPAGLVSRQAKIITDPRAPVIPCTLIDYSPGGACVDLGGQVNIPDCEPRLIPEGAHVHESVVKRMAVEPDYRPVNLPKTYETVPMPVPPHVGVDTGAVADEIVTG